MCSLYGSFRKLFIAVLFFSCSLSYAAQIRAVHNATSPQMSYLSNSFADQDKVASLPFKRHLAPSSYGLLSVLLVNFCLVHPEQRIAVQDSLKWVAVAQNIYLLTLGDKSPNEKRT